MKIIDLLNKIANRIDIPLQIKYDNDIWKYDEMARDYLLIDKSGEEFLIGEELNLTYALNDEVEIIEDKKIEKLENKIDTTFENYNYSERMRLTEMVNKINEIIDYINKEK